MNFKEFAAQSKRNLSPVKQKILTALWDAGESFPKNWVKSSYLLKKTGQKYFDRRIRELRDETGFDIETMQVEGEHCYRLNSPLLTEAKPRQYLPASQKEKLFKDAEYTCQICGKKTQGGVRGLQADHKVPLIRGGSQEIDNWQPVCNECNVVKRRACEGCNDRCLECSWAFPEKFGGSIKVLLSKDEFEKLKKALNGKSAKMSEWAQKVLSQEIREIKA